MPAIAERWAIVTLRQASSRVTGLALPSSVKTGAYSSPAHHPATCDCGRIPHPCSSLARATITPLLYHSPPDRIKHLGGQFPTSFHPSRIRSHTARIPADTFPLPCSRYQSMHSRSCPAPCCILHLQKHRLLCEARDCHVNVLLTQLYPAAAHQQT